MAIITLAAGMRRIETTGGVERIETTRRKCRRRGHIEGNAGDDILLGGQMDDTIAGNEGNNIILGDHGYIDYVVADGDRSDIDAIVSTSTTAFGGADQITAGSGQDIIIGGRFGDTINAGDGDNLVIGDSGQITAAASGAPQLAGLPITLGLVETIAFDDGGVDGITTGSGRDIVLGGDEGDASVSARATTSCWATTAASPTSPTDTDASDIDLIESTSTTVAGGADQITSGDGQDIVIGGRFGDTINAGDGDNLVIGDSGRSRPRRPAQPQLAGLPITLGLVETTAFDDGGVDGITTGSGATSCWAATKATSSDAGQGNNIVLGDDGRIDYALTDTDASDIDLIESTSTTVAGGADEITTGAARTSSSADASATRSTPATATTW